MNNTLDTILLFIFGIFCGIVGLSTLGLLLDLIINLYTGHSIIREFIRPLFN